MQETEIGHFSVTINNKTFKLLPSLRNMATLANSVRILLIYEMIHSPMVPQWYRIDLARDIILACCDDNDIDEHLIYCRKCKPRLSIKKISINDQIVVAAALMRHGVAGVNRPDYDGSKKGSGKPADKFDVNKIVADAMIYFGLSKQEALDLTMSEFCYLLAAKFPPTASQNNSPSLEDHKAAMKALMEKGNV